MKAVLLFKQSTTSAIGLACYMGWFSDATSALIRIAPLPPPIKTSGIYPREEKALKFSSEASYGPWVPPGFSLCT